MLKFLFSLFLFSFYTLFSTNNENNLKDTTNLSIPAKNTNMVLTKATHVFVSKIPSEENRIYSMIDSILDEPNIPIELLEALHAKIEDIKEQQNFMHPANSMYELWENETASPYDFSKIKVDSVIELNLLKSGSTFFIPFQGVITSKYGYRTGRMHKGIDIDLNTLDPIKASFDGEVRVAKNYGGFGKTVIIRHYNGLETIYAHLHKIKVSPNQKIKAGEVIGLGGNTGHSEGSHLHFECRFMGVPINPLSFISVDESSLLTNVLILKKTKYGFAAFPKGAELHVVQKGDYLSKIAQEYGVSIEKICQINNISKNRILRVGEEIRII